MTYGGSDADEARSVQQTLDGSYVVGGATYSFGTTGHAWILKLNPDGAIDWENAYGGPAGAGARCVRQTFNQLGSPNGFIVAGGPAEGPANSDFGVSRLNPNASVAWQKTYGGTDVDTAYAYLQTVVTF